MVISLAAWHLADRICLVDHPIMPVQPNVSVVEIRKSCTANTWRPKCDTVHQGIGLSLFKPGGAQGGYSATKAVSRANYCCTAVLHWEVWIQQVLQSPPYRLVLIDQNSSESFPDELEACRLTNIQNQDSMLKKSTRCRVCGSNSLCPCLMSLASIKKKR